MREFTREEFPETWKVIWRGHEDGVATAFSFGAYFAHTRTGPETLAGAFGETRQGSAARPVSTESIFDLASVSKIYGTSSLAGVFRDRGWLDWEMPVQAVFPEFHSSTVRVKHLLSHTTGLPAWAPLWQTMRERFELRGIQNVSVAERQRAMRELVFQIPSEVPAGTRAVYSDIGFLILGFLLEEMGGGPLDRLVESYIFRKFELGAYYHRVRALPEFDRDLNVVATEDCPWRGDVLQGQVHDDNCWTMGGFGGHAGVFGSVLDLLRWGELLLEGRILSATTRNAMWKRIDFLEGCSRTLGWDTPSGEMATLSPWYSAYSVGHLGYTGTSFWIDPEKGMAVGLLTNRVHPTRENPRIQEFRRAFHRALAQDIRYTGRA